MNPSLRLKTSLLSALSLLCLNAAALPSWASGEDENSTYVKAPDERETTANSESKAPSKLLKGEVTCVVPKGTPLKLKLATVPTHALHLMDYDLDGKLLPAKAGQLITAKVSEDLYVDEDKVIPEGTVFYGKVSRIVPPRRVYRQGSCELSFDRIVTPDGRTFAFRAQADNFRPSTMKSKAKGFGIVASYAAGGAIVGALVAYQIFGLKETIAMHGYNIAGGAAAGALLATGYAVYRKGPVARLEPGDDLNLKIDTDLLMPVAVDPKSKPVAPHLAGLDVKIDKGKLVRDGLGGHILYVDADVDNDSDSKLSSIDVFLEDGNGNRTPLCTSDRDDASMLFTIMPHSTEHVKLAFPVEFPKLKRNMVWLDHDSKTVCLRQPLP